jgi:hypothetical protein
MNNYKLSDALENILSSIYQKESEITHKFAVKTILKFIEDVEEEESQPQLQ